jgi:hypothetical protein
MWLSFSETVVNPGDTVPFTLTLPGGIPANAPLVLTVAFDGRRGPSDTTTVPAAYPVNPTTGEATEYGDVFVPAGSADGTITLTVSLPQEQDSVSASFQVLDTQSPTVTANMTYGSLPAWIPMTWSLPALFVGSTDTLSITASDNGGLAWVGFSIGAPANVRDSVSGQYSPSGILNVTVTPPAAWLSATPAITAFAYDRDGHYTEDSLGKTTVAQHLTRPIRTATIDTATRRAVEDTKRQVVYFAVGDQAAIQVLSLSTMTYNAPIPLPATPVDVDVRPGGDSLVVALAHTADLAFVNLLTSPATVSVVHLNSLNGPGGDTTNLTDTVMSVRQASDGRVIVGAEGGSGPPSSNTPFRGALAQFNPATGTDSLVYVDYYVTRYALVRTGSGTKVLVANVNGGQFILYDAGAHAYNGPMGSFPTWIPYATADSDGSYYGIYDGLYSGTLGSLGPSDIGNRIVGPKPALLSASGTQFYVTTQFPYYVRFAQEPTALNGSTAGVLGVPVDIVDVPEQITAFVPLADTTSLLALGTDEAMVFDLTQSSPSGSHVVMQPRGHGMAAKRRNVATRTLAGSSATPSRPVFTMRVRLGQMNHTFSLPPN